MQNARVTGICLEAGHLGQPLTPTTQRCEFSGPQSRIPSNLGCFLIYGFLTGVFLQVLKERLSTDKFRSSGLRCSICLMGSDCKLPRLHKKPTISSTQTRPVRVSARCQEALHYSVLPRRSQLERIPATLHRQINSKYLQGGQPCRTDSLINS